MNITAVSVTELNRWRLAENLTHGDRIYTTILEIVYFKFLKNIEENEKKFISYDIKNKIWLEISKENEPLLRAFYIKSYCEKILREFSDHEVNLMLMLERDLSRITCGDYKKRFYDLLCQGLPEIRRALTEQAQEIVNSIKTKF